jgi:putative effector of murein hydrolase
MPKFVELWVYLSATPLFGLTATLVVYVVAQAIYARLQQAPWANPVLWTVL